MAAIPPIDPDSINTERAGIRFRRLGACLAAEVSAIDLTRPLDAEQIAALEQALAEHEVLIFREQHISSADLLRFGRYFGELSVHPFAPTGTETPQLIRFRNDAQSAPFGTDIWHSDETFRPAPPRATALCAKVVPAVGGDTLFASMTAAWEGLSERLQQFISGLRAIHDIRPFRRLFGASPAERDRLRAMEDRYPPQAHPLVRVHPVTGRRSLFVNPNFTLHVVDMDPGESHSLLETLYAQIRIPEYQYRLQWAPGTLTLWDNRSVQHYAVHDYYPQRRYMERVTIAGDPVQGETEASTAAARGIKFAVASDADPYGGHRPRDD